MSSLTLNSPTLTLTLILLATLAPLTSQCTRESLNTNYIQNAPSKGQLLFEQYVPIKEAQSLSENSWHKMKIFMDISPLDSLASTDRSTYDWLTKMLLPISQHYLEQLLQVRESGHVVVPSGASSCSKYVFPSGMKRTYLNTDLLLIITADAKKSDGFVAWASPCFLSNKTGRPVIGRVNINPYHLDKRFKMFFDQFGTLVHEVVHILGFSKFLYQYFIDDNFRRIGESNILRRMTVQGKSWLFLTTPNVRQQAQKHFNCMEIQGLAVEDEGSAGSAGSHWEKTFLGNEFMVANVVPNPVVSIITLALLQDSGWYKVNFDKAERIYWGKDDGCRIFGGNCGAHEQLCTTNTVHGCFYDYTFEANCRKDSFLNGCQAMLTSSMSTQDCRFADNTDADDQAFYEYHGMTSRCFTGTATNKGRSKSGSMCLKNKCVGNKLYVELKDQTYPCSSKGQGIKVGLWQSGGFYCPDPVDFCEQKNASCPEDCNMKGRCLSNGKCDCFKGFSGTSCNDGAHVSGLAGQSGPCPNNCSGKGTCNKELNYCMCNSGYSGTSCEKYVGTRYLGDRVLQVGFTMIGAALLAFVALVM